MGVLDNKDRFEYALEKCTELGMTDFYPFYTKFSQKKHLKVERLEAKAIAAMKQCKRSRLVRIHDTIKAGDLIGIFAEYKRIVVLDEAGYHPRLGDKGADTLVVGGPEGGLSDEEMQAIYSLGAEGWNLGARRLRAETAAVLGCGLVSLINQQKRR